MIMAVEEGEGLASCPGRSLPPGKTPYPLYRRLDGPQGRSGQVRKISHPPGFDPRTVQPVASQYCRITVYKTAHDICTLLHLINQNVAGLAIAQLPFAQHGGLCL